MKHPSLVRKVNRSAGWRADDRQRNVELRRLADAAERIAVALEAANQPRILAPPAVPTDGEMHSARLWWSLSVEEEAAIPDLPTSDGAGETRGGR